MKPKNCETKKDEYPLEIAVMDFETAKYNTVWGTYGESGREPLRWVRLIDCSTDHLQKILETQPISTTYSKIIQSILVDRKV